VRFWVSILRRKKVIFVMTQPTIHLDTLLEKPMRQSFKTFFFVLFFKTFFFDKFEWIEFHRCCPPTNVIWNVKPQISWTTLFHKLNCQTSFTSWSEQTNEENWGIFFVNIFVFERCVRSYWNCNSCTKCISQSWINPITLS
jgi:hypothetical protein